MQVSFKVGDLVAHKCYPEIPIGHINKFYNSGRVGVLEDGYQKSYLPKNLILVETKLTNSEAEVEILVETPLEDDDDDLDPPSVSCRRPKPVAPISPAQAEELVDAIAFSEVMVLRMKPENLPDRYENCPQCGSNDLRHSTFHDPDEYYFYCKNCGREGWSVPTNSPIPAQVEELVEEIDWNYLKYFDAYSTIELSPIPREIIPEQMPEWFEKPFLPELYREDSDEDEYWEFIDPGYFINAKYRGWNALVQESGEIYALEPNGERCWWCECDENFDRQIAIVQEFIDSWYFAQPSPGQLSLDIVEAVARDPPRDG